MKKNWFGRSSRQQRRMFVMFAFIVGGSVRLIWQSAKIQFFPTHTTSENNDNHPNNNNNDWKNRDHHHQQRTNRNHDWEAYLPSVFDLLPVVSTTQTTTTTSSMIRSVMETVASSGGYKSETADEDDDNEIRDTSIQSRHVSKESSGFPRVFHWKEKSKSDSLSFKNSKLKSNQSIIGDPIMTTSHETMFVLPEPKEPNPVKPSYREFETEWHTQCQPIKKIPIRPICNSLHELNPFQSQDVVLLSLEGNWRSVWKVHLQHLQQQSPKANSNSTTTTTTLSTRNESIILKLLQWNREFDDDAYQSQAVDSIVMEQLTGSPYIVSSFGFCGQSVLTELAKSSGASLIKDPALHWRQRLQLARDLARGLAELHILQPITFPSTIRKKQKKKRTTQATTQHSPEPPSNIQDEEKNSTMNATTTTVAIIVSTEAEAQAATNHTTIASRWTPRRTRSRFSDLIAIQPDDGSEDGKGILRLNPSIADDDDDTGGNDNGDENDNNDDSSDQDSDGAATDDERISSSTPHLSTPKPIFAHYDINVANTISIREGSVQWNDFNLGVLTRRYMTEDTTQPNPHNNLDDNNSNNNENMDNPNPTVNQFPHNLDDADGVEFGRLESTAPLAKRKKCPVPIRYGGALWRSPEEIQNTTGYLFNVHSADVYAFGHVLFIIFTKRQPWTHLELDHNLSGNSTNTDPISQAKHREEVTAIKKVRGDMPHLPRKYHSQRWEAMILWESAKACLRLDPQQRPTAYSLALGLGTAYDWSVSHYNPTTEQIQDLFAIR